MTNWIDVNERLPPDKLVKVKDSEGNTASAHPCWYPFRLERMVAGRYNFDVVKCEPYMEGWLIQAVGFDIPKIGTITHWQQLPQLPQSITN